MKSICSGGGYEQLELNDNGETLIKLMLILYADDTAIVADSADMLQKGLVVLGDYCSKWRLKINIDKTKITIFERSRSRTNKDFVYNGKSIEIVNEFCYLGTILRANGSVKPAIDKQITQGEKAMFSLIKKSRKLGLPLDIQLDLFHKLITPILTYNCEFWGFSETHLEMIETLHLKYIRFILKLNNSTPKPMLYGETGEMPIKIVIITRIICYLAKLRGMEGTSLAKTMFKAMMKMHLRGGYTTRWLAGVLRYLIDLDLVEPLLGQPVIKISSIKRIVKFRLKNKFLKSWSERIASLSKCDLYNMYKLRFEREKYLRTLPTTLVITLYKFRTSNHPLEVEKMRYVRPIIPRRLRKCTMYNLNETRNKYHFLFICPRFEELRIKYIPNNFRRNVNFCKVLDILSTKNGKLLLSLTKFIREALKVYITL